jgi:hypothetical protein
MYRVVDFQWKWVQHCVLSWLLLRGRRLSWRQSWSSSRRQSRWVGEAFFVGVMVDNMV